MITTEQLANLFETELNALLDYENLSFKIWASVGKKQEGLRQGNDVFSYINGNIRVVASSITANRLVMGVNNLTVTFDIPLDPPKTTAAQTAEFLATIKNGQYWFAQYIMEILSGYFQKYQALEMQDENGVTYGIGLVAGVSLPQGVDLTAWRGNSLTVDVYVEANIVQGGILSLNIAVELDGEPLPFQSFTPDRQGVLAPDVYSGSDVSKVIATSSAFAAEASIPTNSVYGSSAFAVSYLLHGDPNTAHFLKIEWGNAEDADSALYLVTFTRATGGMQGVTIASVTFQIAQVQDDMELINVPSGFQVGYFVLASSDVTSFSFSVSGGCLAYIAGKAYELAAGAQQTVALAEQDIVYNEDSDEYRLYLITSAAVTVTAAGYTFEIVNEEESDG